MNAIAKQIKNKPESLFDFKLDVAPANDNIWGRVFA